MSKVPTVTLKHKVHGMMKVNAEDYGMNIGGWVDKGWKLVNEKGNALEVNSNTAPEGSPEVASPTPPKKGDEVYAILKGGTKVHTVKVVSVNKKEGTFVGEVETGGEKDFTFDQLVPPESVETIEDGGKE